MAKQEARRRDQVDPQFTWDLAAMYKDQAAFEADYQKAEEKIADLAHYEGKLGQSSQMLAQALDAYFETLRVIENVYVYTSMLNDQDQTVSASQALKDRAGQLFAKFGQAVAYFDPELLAIPEEELQTFIEENDRLGFYRHFLDDKARFRPHVLSSDQELLLAQASEANQTASKTFGLLSDADLKFPTIKDEEGHDVELTHSVYGKLLESSDRRVRRDNFKAYYSVYDQFKNTFASLITGQMKLHNYQAKVRHFDSARQAALFENNIPESVYDTLIEAVHSRLDLLHRFVALRKKLLNVDDLEMYDMYTPLLGEAPIKVTYDEAKAIVLEAVKPMGEDYVAIIEEAFRDRWIDLYENIGKRSGAYSSGSYDSKAYILMNWQDSINHLYTLIHELGHSVHSHYAKNNQEYAYGGYPIFLAEIASTTNENLLTYYLLDKYEDPEIRLFILNNFLDSAKGTVFRQTQFAEFEHFMHEEDAKGQPLTQDFLSEHYRALNAKYYGPEVNSDSEIALEWSRIPHFYYNYYVFQYATGFSAAAFFAKKIHSGDQEALERYKGFLKSGDSKYAVDTMKDAGLDMTQADYIQATLDLFEERLDEFESLLEKQ